MKSAESSWGVAFLMKRIVEWTLAGIGAALCVGQAAGSWHSPSSCPVPALVLVELAALGLVGLAAVFLAGKNPSVRWAMVAWAVIGGLLGLMVITVWSIAPWVLLAAMALGGAAILASTRGGPKALTHLGILTVVAIVNFVLLFALAKDSGIEVVQVPAGSLGAQVFATTDYADAYRGRLSAGSRDDLERVTRAVLASLIPCWERQWAKQSVRDGWIAAMRGFAFQPGTTVPMIRWKVYQRAADELVIGLDESHLNFRVSILLSEENGVRWVTVSTLVHYNNWKGRAYFVPVRIGHQIILPQAVRTTIHLLQAGTARGTAELCRAPGTHS